MRFKMIFLAALFFSAPSAFAQAYSVPIPGTEGMGTLSCDKTFRSMESYLKDESSLLKNFQSHFNEVRDYIAKEAQYQERKKTGQASADEEQALNKEKGQLSFDRGFLDASDFCHNKTGNRAAKLISAYQDSVSRLKMISSDRISKNEKQKAANDELRIRVKALRDSLLTY